MTPLLTLLLCAAAAKPPAAAADAAAAAAAQLSAAMESAHRAKELAQQVKRNIAVELKTLKLTRQWIEAQYVPFAAGRATFTMLKHHLAKKLALPHTAFAPGKRMGDLVDDEVHAVTARCDTGKRAMERCVWPTPTNVLWDLSVETIIAEASLNPNSVEAQRVRERERESAAAAQRISNVLHASRSPYDFTSADGSAILRRGAGFAAYQWVVGGIVLFAATGVVLRSKPEWGAWLCGLTRGVRSSRGGKKKLTREQKARRSKLLKQRRR